MIRITGGNNRSRKLETPDVATTKPTMDKVRAAVFNILNEDIKGKKVLDLFAGSGSYGFEALSRGAAFATFVDNNKDAINSIKKNASILKEENISIINSDVASFLESTNDKFDIVFMDPPYKLEIYEKIVELLEKNELLQPFSIIVLESDKELNITETDYRKIKTYKYGLARIYVLRYQR